MELVKVDWSFDHIDLARFIWNELIHRVWN
jgi:hypothetical protein